ncbi:GNAT family N-acetyltransferase [Enterobacteriaceae bacterium RIT702]|nr:GNAT family N-acetyltransferase [Enterobacteriaceae bacterium RIT702]
MVNIRPAVEKDAAVITDIYNRAVQNSTAIWNDNTVDIANRIKWLSDRQSAGFPVLVAVDEDDIALGYASYGDWRPWDGYRYTVEHSVYVHNAAQGKGLGLALMRSLITHATAQGKHIMVAGIESENTPSIALHLKLGFTDAGQIKQVGTKFGRWLDLTFMQLRLDNRDKP